jgi:WD40 repeat protein
MGPTFRPPEGHTEFGYVYALLLGLNGRVYSASKDTPIRVWLGDDGAHIQTLEGHTDGVTVFFCGSLDCNSSLDICCKHSHRERFLLQIGAFVSNFGTTKFLKFGEKLPFR